MIYLISTSKGCELDDRKVFLLVAAVPTTDYLGYLGFLVYGRFICYIRGAHISLRPLAQRGRAELRGLLQLMAHGSWLMTLQKPIAIDGAGAVADDSAEGRWRLFISS